MTNAPAMIAARSSAVARDLLRTNLKAQQHELELTIGATPTGPVRNALTDANIALLVCIAGIEVAMTEAKKAQQ